MRQRIVKELKESVAVKAALSDRIIVEQISEVINLMIAAIKKGGRIYLFGNGGSAADAQHIAAELVGRFKLDRPPLPAIALTTDTSVLTSIGNDYGSDEIFIRQVDALMGKNDVAIGISTSGDSLNVVKGIEAAKAKGAATICLTGRSGGKLSELPDVCLKVPSDNTPRIQEAHITLGHIICGLIEQELFGDEANKISKREG